MSGAIVSDTGPLVQEQGFADLLKAVNALALQKEEELGKPPALPLNGALAEVLDSQGLDIFLA